MKDSELPKGELRGVKKRFETDQTRPHSAGAVGEAVMEMFRHNYVRG